MSRRDEYNPVASEIPFDNTDTDFESDNVRDAIIEAKGIRTYPVELHYVNGTGGSTTMGNGSFFRTKPGTFPSGSYSGYNACFPLLVNFKSKLVSLRLVFTIANFDWTATSGPVSFDIEFRSMTHDGSVVHSMYRISWGNYSGSQVPYAFNTFDLDSSNITLLSGPDNIDADNLIGFRFVKSTAPARNINNFSDILLTLSFEEDKS